ncbi:uncharacterized protein MAM_04408 [Metarhizium album ARSEF 1941]|uniref:Transcription factor, fungi n=1 Tax=Metarhizium album (strain ARSEF 1941) TaxID=1081103 RepID=A0A0B2WWM5_METAS|nr:uncharacterized protein MAM_04408 [Metarhizium album ARSEF 1941]KHN98019.1 Transcription factor, fungi [Metarhizium album ARSEF 1941]
MPTRKVKDSERRRCVQACGNCKRRKERCDGRQPCQRCVKRRVHSECRFGLQLPAVESSRFPPSPETSSLGGFPLTPQDTPQGNDDMASLPDQEHLASFVSKNVVRSSGNDSVRVVLPAGDVTNHGFLTDIRHVVRTHLGKHVFSHDDPRLMALQAPPDRRDRPLDHVTNLSLAKPDMDDIQYILPWYERATSFVCHIFDCEAVRAGIQDWASQPESQSAAMSATYSLILAVGAQACRHRRDDCARRHFINGQYITLVALMNRPDMSTVKCLLLITVYLVAESCGDAAAMHFGAAVRIAQALGLHRQDACWVESDSADFLTRKRLWNSIRILDVQLRATFGRVATALKTSGTGGAWGLSASDDLCSIFDKTLSRVYDKKDVTIEHVSTLSELHRDWASRYQGGLKAEGTYANAVTVDTGRPVPDYSLVHLETMHHWSVMLSLRPCLLDHVATALSQEPCKEPFAGGSPALDKNVDLVRACVSSAFCVVQLLEPLAGGVDAPRRLPLMANAAVTASLVLSLALFGATDDAVSVARALGGCRKVIKAFGCHDVETWLDTIDNMQSVYKASSEARRRRRMELDSRLINHLYGYLDGKDADTSRLQNTQDPAMWNCRRESRASMTPCTTWLDDAENKTGLGHGWSSTAVVGGVLSAEYAYAPASFDLDQDFVLRDFSSTASYLGFDGDASLSWGKNRRHEDVAFGAGSHVVI